MPALHACVPLLALLQGGGGMPTLDEVLRANAYELTHDGELGGPALDFLVRELADVQFLALGEPHNVDRVPELVTGLLEALLELGFRNLALEQGPFVVEALRDAAVSGGREGLFEVAARYPAALHFYTDQELAMIADVAALPGASVWGLDRTLSAVLPLEYLVERAPDADVRSVLDGLLRDSRSFDREHLLEQRQLVSSSPELFLELPELFGPTEDPECAWRLERLAFSARNARLFRRAATGNADGYLSNLEREEAMKDAFLRHYRRAREAGVERPRVVLKLGHYHVIRGLSWSNVYTLGNFLDGLARAGGLRSFHIDVSVVNPPGQHWSLLDHEELAPLARAADVRRWTLIDLRPLRGLIHSGTFPVGDELRRRVFGFDAALVLGDTHEGTTEWAKPLLEGGE